MGPGFESQRDHRCQKFYIIGDDSNKILCLNKKLKFVKILFYLSLMAIRIVKKDKPDFEACTIYNHNLLLFGSGSKLLDAVFYIDTI
jgi:hypothetical protein